MSGATAPRLACPACGGSLDEGDEMTCEGCGRRFPVVAGIPDLRWDYGDPELPREEDTARARELDARAREHGLAELLREHWRRSGIPPELAERFVTGDLVTLRRSRSYLEAIDRERGRPVGADDRFLEVGCGTAGLAAAAAERGAAVVASDVSLRWLVLARARLRESGLEGVRLVCCTAERMPFPPASFDVVAASDVVEHVPDPPGLAAGARRVLRSGGLLFLSTPNRYSLGLEPHVRLWGVGLLPRRLARRYVRRARGVEYRNIRPLSFRGVRRLLAHRGFTVRVVPPAIPAGTQDLYGGVELALVRAYNRARRCRPVRGVLLLVGPLFHVFAEAE